MDVLIWHYKSERRESKHWFSIARWPLRLYWKGIICTDPPLIFHRSVTASPKRLAQKVVSKTPFLLFFPTGSIVPPRSTDLSPLCIVLPVGDHRFRDIVRLDEILPSLIVDREDGLALDDVVLRIAVLFCRVRFLGDYEDELFSALTCRRVKAGLATYQWTASHRRHSISHKSPP